MKRKRSRFHSITFIEQYSFEKFEIIFFFFLKKNWFCFCSKFLPKNLANLSPMKFGFTFLSLFVTSKKCAVFFPFWSLFYCLVIAESLKHASGVSILLAVMFVAICSAMAIHAMWEGKTQGLRLIPDFANGVSFFDLFTTLPVFATGFACHFCGKHQICLFGHLKTGKLYRSRI